MELNKIANDAPAWTTTSDGNNIHRDAYLDLLVEEVLEDCNPLDALIAALAADKRKSLSKRAILELIEECR